MPLDARSRPMNFANGVQATLNLGLKTAAVHQRFVWEKTEEVVSQHNARPASCAMVVRTTWAKAGQFCVCIQLSRKVFFADALCTVCRPSNPAKHQFFSSF